MRQTNNAGRPAAARRWNRGIHILLLAALVLAMSGVWQSSWQASIAQGPCGSTVTVTRGDTLTSIARRCGTTVAALLEANPEIANPDLIHVGQTLTIGSPESSPDGTEGTGQEGAGLPETYVVKRGDTLSRIASAFDVTLQGLMEANPSIQDRNLIHVGQRLAIPGTTIQVSASGLPADTPVEVGAGVVDTEFGVVEDARTDADGALDGEIVLPEFARAGEEWVVVVRVIGTQIKGTSEVFQVTLDGQAGDQDATVSKVTIYLVALGDAGQIGRQIGCDDSLVPVEVDVEPTGTPLRTALERLLAVESATQGDTELYNALYGSDLTVDEVRIDGGRAAIALSGTLQLGGVCDTPRVEEQLRETALQFPAVTEVDISINGVPLDEALSARG